jgi:hypothetical protein
MIHPTIAIDWNELVQVYDSGPTKPANGRPLKDQPPTEIMTLSNAVRLIVEVWDSDRLRQLQAAIVRQVLPSFHTFVEIKAIYDRPDFPGRAANDDAMAGQQA